MADFVPVAEEVGGQTKPTPTPDKSGYSPNEVWGKTETIPSYVNNGKYKYFESIKHKTTDGKEFRYTIEFVNYDSSDTAAILVRFKGYDNNGTDISQDFDIGSKNTSKSSSGKTIVYSNLRSRKTQLTSTELTIYKEGKLNIKINGMDRDIELFLVEKLSTN